MGLFDKLKKQAMDSLNELQSSVQEKINNVQSRQLTEDLPSPQYVQHNEEIVNEYHSQIPPATPSVSPMEEMQSQNIQPSKQIYNQYLENLIEMALADGELTEKEKQVLFKKAEAQGIDLDEFEMVLDAKLYERKKATNSVNSIPVGSAPKSDKFGDVKKCPNCGAIVESFKTRCQDCGYEFRNIGTVSSFTLLSSKLEELDRKKNGKISLFGVSNDQVIDDKKASIIQSFPVPTTKEDILEFLSMAVPLGKPATKSVFRTNLGAYEYGIAKAWKSKCEQVIIKARFSMKDDRSTLDEINNYAASLNMK